MLLVAGAGAADGLAAFSAKIVAEDASSGLWLAVIGWVALIGAVVAMGLISESTALQRAPATRVAPTVLVMQIVIPVAFAPLVGGESWSSTPLNGGVLVGAMLGVVAGVRTPGELTGGRRRDRGGRVGASLSRARRRGWRPERVRRPPGGTRRTGPALWARRARR